MLMAVTVLRTARLNPVRTSQHLIAGNAGRDDDSFAPLVKVRLRVSNLLRLGLLHTLWPEMEIDLDGVWSPVARLLPLLFHKERAGELVAEPRSQ